MSHSDDLPVAGTAVLLRDGSDGVEVLLMRRPARGSFADAWVFPGGRVEDIDRLPGAAEVDDACRGAIRETFEEVGIAVSGLVPISCWHPPAEAPTRIRTWFFVGTVQDGEILAAADEVVDTVWIRADRALARHATGELTLFPPTWVTLHGIRAFDSADAVLASVDEPRMYRTRMTATSEGLVFSWGEDRLETGALPWRFIRAEAG